MHCGAALRRPATALSAVIMSTLFVSSWHNSKFDLSAKKTPIMRSLMFFILINRNLLSCHIMDVTEDQVAKQTRLIQTAVFWDVMLCSQYTGTNILEKPVTSSSTWRWRQKFCLKHCYLFTELYIVTSQKTATWPFTTTKTSNFTHIIADPSHTLYCWHLP